MSGGIGGDARSGDAPEQIAREIEDEMPGARRGPEEAVVGRVLREEGIERFAGIVGGLAILLIVSLLIWPTDEERADAS